MAWARANLDIPADALAIRCGENANGACVWVERPHPEGNNRLDQQMVQVPQFATMMELRARFLLDQDGQISLDLLS